jgi:hypothetical protein
LSHANLQRIAQDQIAGFDGALIKFSQMPLAAMNVHSFSFQKIPIVFSPYAEAQPTGEAVHYQYSVVRVKIVL